jgi:hypothetical protein
VRDNNKNKHRIDKNLNHRVTQKVWRLQQQQEKYKNMHSITSRHQERQELGHGRGQDDITKVKTLQDATLKASRLYGMMTDFIHPSKINYRKIHSKWRNMKKQVQVGRGGPGTGTGTVTGTGTGTGTVTGTVTGTGTEPDPEPKIITVSRKAGTTVPVDDKECLELPPKLSLHVTSHPDDPNKFIVTKKDGDPLIYGSLTKFAEGLMGDLEKIKKGTEFDISDADILAKIAYDLIIIILNALDKPLDDVDDDDDDDDVHGSKLKKRLLAAALDAESRNAAAAAILIALIGLIKKKGHEDDSRSSVASTIGDDSVVDDIDVEQDLRDAIERLEGILTAASAEIDDRRADNDTLNRRVGELRRAINDLNVYIEGLETRLENVNARNAVEVANLQRQNRLLDNANQRLAAQCETLQHQVHHLREEKDQLEEEGNQQWRQALQDLETVLKTTRERSSVCQQLLQKRNQDLEAELANQGTEIARQRDDLARLNAASGDRGQEIAAAREALAQRERELRSAQLAHQEQLHAAHGEARRLREDGQETIRQLEEENSKTAKDLDQATQRLNELQNQLGSLRQDETGARERFEARLREERLERDRLEDEFRRQAAELDELKQRPQATDTASADALRIAVNVLKQQLDRKLQQVKTNIQTLPQQQQQQLEEQAVEIYRGIQSMQDSTPFKGLDERITQLTTEVDQAIQAAQREEEDRARREAELARATVEVIQERLTRRFKGMPGSEETKQRILGRIQDAKRLQDECEITKAILKVELEIERRKITTLNETDKCRKQYLTKVGEITASIDGIDCSDGIERGYSEIKPKIKELREAQGDKLRTFVVMRGGGDPSAAGITLNARANTVEWNPMAGRSQTVEFSGVFEAGAHNSAKYAQVRTLLDKIPVDQATVVIFGYGYSGSGKTYTLLGKRIEDTLKSLALADKRKLQSSFIDTLQAKMRSVKTARDHDSYMTAITDLKTFLKSNKYHESEVDRVKEVEGIAHIAIRDYIHARNTVILEEVFEMYDDSYYFATDSGKYQEDDGGKSRAKKLYPIIGYDISGRMGSWIVDGGKVVNPFKLDHPIDDADKFNEVIRKVEQTRKDKGHIKPTPNNPESSRGHLFIKLKIISPQGLEGRLIICDMGGRENPQDIWETGKYCPSKIEGRPPIPISRANTDVAYTDDGIEVACTTKREDDRLSFSKAFSKGFESGRGDIKLETALQAGTKGNPGILQTLKQGFYINDSINELLHVFGYKGTDKKTNWTDIVNKEKTGVWTYTPEVRATSVSDHIRMNFIFNRFKEESDCKITFCTFACIRPESTFNDDNVKTLNFARDVNSCSDSAGGGAAAAQGGAKTHRNRPQGKARTQRRRRRRIVKPKSHPLTVTTQRRNMRDKKKGRRTRKMK